MNSSIIEKIKNMNIWKEEKALLLLLAQSMEKLLEAKPEVCIINDIVVWFEAIPDDQVFTSSKGNETYLEYKQKVKKLIEKIALKLKKKGYRMVEIATIGYFYSENKRKGPFIQLDTMFLIRLLKRNRKKEILNKIKKI